MEIPSSTNNSSSSTMKTTTAFNEETSSPTTTTTTTTTTMIADDETSSPTMAPPTTLHIPPSSTSTLEPTTTTMAPTTESQKMIVNTLSNFLPGLLIATKKYQKDALAWLENDVNENGLPLLLQGEVKVDNNWRNLLLERYVMAVLYFATTTTTSSSSGVEDEDEDSSVWINSDGWLSGESICDWQFLQCDPDNNHQVISIDLDSNGLVGHIPTTELATLTALQEIYLYENSLSGTIGTEFGSLTKLTGLALMSNENLTGTIPRELGNLTNLIWLNIYNTGLSGTIPTEFGQLTALTQLHMHNNNLTGEIPSELDPILDSLSFCLLTGNQGLTGIPSNCSR